MNGEQRMKVQKLMLAVSTTLFATFVSANPGTSKLAKVVAIQQAKISSLEAKINELERSVEFFEPDMKLLGSGNCLALKNQYLLVKVNHVKGKHYATLYSSYKCKNWNVASNVFGVSFEMPYKPKGGQAVGVYERFGPMTGPNESQAAALWEFENGTQSLIARGPSSGNWSLQSDHDLIFQIGPIEVVPTEK